MLLGVGLGSFSFYKQGDVRRFILQQDLSFISLVENKIRVVNINSVCRFIVRDWGHEDNLSVVNG